MTDSCPRLIADACDIAKDSEPIICVEPAGPEEIACLHSTLCQIGLPRRRLADRVFERMNGKRSILLKAGELHDGETWVPQPPPFGPKARLLMLDWCSFARRNHTRVIPLGHPTDYLRHRLGLKSQGSQIHAMYEQVRAWVACELKISQPLAGGRVEVVNMTPTARSVSMIEARTTRTIWPEALELTAEAYASLAEHSVPLDYSAIRRLSGTALGLDLYVCWAERLRRIPRNKPLFLSWAYLQSQFGGYSSRKDFQSEFRARVVQVWHGAYRANVEFVPGGMKWRHTKAPVPER